jgi:hypothetical protein
MYLNVNNPVNYQLQGFGQNGVRTISTDQLYIQGEYYRVLVAEEDSYVTAVSVLGDDLTAEFVYAGTTIYGLFTEVSVTSGSLTAYIAGPTDIEDVWAYINAYGLTNAATIEAVDCAKGAIASLLDKYYAKASLVMVPSLYKTSIVYSERPLTTAGQLAFTRSNDTATRVGPDGYIEKVRTNVVLQSNTFSTTWVNLYTTETSGQAGYDGTNNAWLIIKSSASANIQQTVVATGLLTQSVYAKAGTLNWFLMNNSGVLSTGVYFDLQNGVLGSVGANAISPSIEAVGGGWYRCSLSFNGTSSAVRIYPADGNNDISGTSGNILIQAAQLEAGDIATDYIPTTTAAVSVGPVANLPRLNYPINSDGSVGCPSLLLEPQRTNIVTYSEQFDNAAWIKTQASVTANNTTSPAGFVDADKLVGTAVLNVHVAAQNIVAPSAGVYSASAFFKKSEYNFGLIRLITDSAVNRFSALINLTTGAIENTYTVGSPTSTSVKVDDYGNGWYRLSVMSAHTSGDVSISVAMSNTASPSIAGGLPTFLADGTSGIFVWGAQLELGAYPTSYIPTIGAAVTRGADSCSKTGISSLIGQTEGTLFVEVDYSTLSGISMFFSIRPDGSNKVEVYRDGGTIYGELTAGSSFALTGSKAVGTHKIAFAYKSGSSALYIDGVLAAQSTTAFSFTSSLVDIAINARSGGAFNEAANYKQVLLFPTRLTNQELQDLTTL